VGRVRLLWDILGFAGVSLVGLFCWFLYWPLLFLWLGLVCLGLAVLGSKLWQ
jgi:hypothetical protein